MKQKILWGICGIGNGHIFRQLSLIEHFAKSSEIVIFGYGESYDFYQKRFAGHPDVSVERVAVPFYVGTKDGLDFEATAKRPENQQDFDAINGKACRSAEAKIGRPDLVVSDYEPISAQYAYEHNAPLVTVDQQSKYLSGDFPALLNGQGYADEVERLRLFFPKADHRLACSFFQVPDRAGATEKVEICAPTLNDKITGLARNPEPDGKSILIYVSSQQPFGQSFEEIAEICGTLSNVCFHMFGKNIPEQSLPNVTVYEHGDARFHEILARCNGIVSTAGHSLLSEAMFLGIPVYAIPLPLYEQEMNAHVIHQNGFGLSSFKISADTISQFVQKIPAYAARIKTDETILLKGPGQERIINHLSASFRP